MSEDYWEARSERVTREILAVCAAIGADKFGRIRVFAIPQEPDDEHPENREYYVETDVLTHAPTASNGMALVNGTEKRVYRLVLEPSDVVPPPLKNLDDHDHDRS